MTENQITPGQFYRQLVADLGFGRATADDDALKVRLAHGLEEAQLEPGPSMTRYITATGLLAFGRAEMVEIILTNVPQLPSEGKGAKVLYLGVNGLRALLPLPERLRGEAGWYTLPDLDGTGRWWRENRERVRWDPSLESFVLSD